MGVGNPGPCPCPAERGRGCRAGCTASIDRLGRTRVRVELARAYLLYGEWLRRGVAAWTPARSSIAHDLLEAMGVEAFAERARRELLAWQGRPQTHRRHQRQLTAQEALIAHWPATDCRTEIGTRLFISARTVQYHLGKVFTKLAITSRSQLHRVLPRDPATTKPE